MDILYDGNRETLRYALLSSLGMKADSGYIDVLTEERLDRTQFNFAKHFPGMLASGLIWITI